MHWNVPFGFASRRHTYLEKTLSSSRISVVSFIKIAYKNAPYFHKRGALIMKYNNNNYEKKRKNQ